MAKRVTVRVSMSEIGLVGLDALCRDLNVNRAEAIRYAVSRVLMRSTLEKCEAAQREDRKRQIAEDLQHARWQDEFSPEPI